MDPVTQTPAAAMTPEAMEGLIATAVAKALAEAERKRKATNNMGELPTGQPESELAPTPGVHVGKDADEGTGIGFARYIKAVAVGKMLGRTPETVARSWGYGKVADAIKGHLAAVEKDLSQGTLADGGVLVPPQFAAEFIALLRNVTVIRRAGARQIPMGASLRIPKQTGAGTAYWGEENATITASQQAFGDVELQEKKLTALTRVSNDLIRNASLSAEEIVRDDLLRVVSIAEDLAFLRGSGAASSPKGIRNWLNAAHVYPETITTPGSPSILEMKVELNKAIALLKAAKIPMTRCCWIMSPRTERGIMNPVGPGAEGYNSLEREMVTSETLRRFPYFWTQQVPENTGGGTDSELYLVDMDQVVIGDSLQMELLVFPNGGDTGITKDQTMIRCIKKTDLVVRYDKCGICVSDISWQ